MQPRRVKKTTIPSNFNYEAVLEVPTIQAFLRTFSRDKENWNSLIEAVLSYGIHCLSTNYSLHTLRTQDIEMIARDVLKAPRNYNVRQPKKRIGSHMISKSPERKSKASSTWRAGEAINLLSNSSKQHQPRPDSLEPKVPSFKGVLGKSDLLWYERNFGESFVERAWKHFISLGYPSISPSSHEISKSYYTLIKDLSNLPYPEIRSLGIKILDGKEDMIENEQPVSFADFLQGFLIRELYIPRIYKESIIEDSTQSSQESTNSSKDSNSMSTSSSSSSSCCGCYEGRGRRRSCKSRRSKSCRKHGSRSRSCCSRSRSNSRSRSKSQSRLKSKSQRNGATSKTHHSQKQNHKVDLIRQRSSPKGILKKRDSISPNKPSKKINNVKSSIADEIKQRRANVLRIRKTKQQMLREQLAKRRLGKVENGEKLNSQYSNPIGKHPGSTALEIADAFAESPFMDKFTGNQIELSKQIDLNSNYEDLLKTEEETRQLNMQNVLNKLDNLELYGNLPASWNVYQKPETNVFQKKSPIDPLRQAYTGWLGDFGAPHTRTVRREGWNLDENDEEIDLEGLKPQKFSKRYSWNFDEIEKEAELDHQRKKTAKWKTALEENLTNDIFLNESDDEWYENDQKISIDPFEKKDPVFEWFQESNDEMKI